MIYTVTFNPSLDYVVRMKHFETGAINRAEQETIYPGGKGINVALVLGNLHIPARIWALQPVLQARRSSAFARKTAAIVILLRSIREIPASI